MQLRRGIVRAVVPCRTILLNSLQVLTKLITIKVLLVQQYLRKF